jgi:hypothetical protein
LVDDETRSPEFAASLGDDDFHTEVILSNVHNIVLDCSRMQVFSIPEMPRFLDQQFAEMMRDCAVEKISVIINEEWLSVMSGIFEGIEKRHQTAPQIRFFDTNSFYNSFDPVAWF